MGKDFGLIESDYTFFMAHATEAESDVAEYVRALSGFAEGRASIRMLDFGCGTGEFTERLALALNWLPQSLSLTLVEPVSHHRDEAVRRLAKFSRHSLESLERLPVTQSPRFDLVLSNHVLYYVDDLSETLRQMVQLVSPCGRLLLAIAGWDNALMELWKIGFAMIGRPVPYYAAEDVEAILSQQGAGPRKSKAYYQLRFPNTVENRLKVLRFLFGDYLQEISPQRLLSEFDRYVRGDHIEVNTHSYQFAIESPRPSE